MSGDAGPMTFFVDAAGCSGCKACEVACMDRHGLEPGRQWRRVSEVSGGGFERDGAGWRSSVFAYHLSISCNHCERPICLEACPTRAIKRRDDGIVLIDADHCMGCGYCGWVCPYGAPQYHAERGVMTKCSFCVEDLDAGGEPACVTACPVRALDAGEHGRLVERHGTNGRSAGLAPLPARELTEPALLVAPHAQASRSDEPDVECTPQPARGLREWCLVVFTVLAQTAVGLTLFGAGLRAWGAQQLELAILPVVIGLLTVAMCGSLSHLGRKRNAIRAVWNLRSSWLSREILAIVALLGVTAVAWWANLSGNHGAVRTWAGWMTVPVALFLLFVMARVYMQRTIPVWNHRRTPLTFGATAVLAGGLAANVVVWSTGSLPIGQTRLASLWILAICLFGAGVPLVLSDIPGRASRPGRVMVGLLGGSSVVAGLAMLVVLAIRREAAAEATPVVLSWIALGLALVDQLVRRRDYFARFERLGI